MVSAMPLSKHQERYARLWPSDSEFREPLHQAMFTHYPKKTIAEVRRLNLRFQVVTLDESYAPFKYGISTYAR